MRLDRLIERVENGAPFASREDALSALVSTASVLDELLPRGLSHDLARALPRELAEVFGPGRGPQSLDERAIYLHVARRTGQTLARAAERTQVALTAIASELSAELNGRLVRELPEGLRVCLEPRALNLAATPGLHSKGHTLAEGRPGSARPLSEARPDEEREIATAHGARDSEGSLGAKNPHADTKLSSARGYLQERERETLAEGKTRGKE